MLGVDRLIGQACIECLGDAEVDHLGNRLAVVQRDQHVGRFDVAMNDPFLVRMLDRLANLDEQFQPFLGSSAGCDRSTR